MQTKSIAIQPFNSISPNQQKVEHLDVAFYLAVNLAIFSIIGVLIFADIPKWWQYLFRFDSSRKIPCRRCQYFNDNQFLKCTLHPATTMTKQSFDCRDYSPHNQQKQVEQTSDSLDSRSWHRIIQNIFHK
jgi:hypothetical protein